MKQKEVQEASGLPANNRNGSSTIEQTITLQSLEKNYMYLNSVQMNRSLNRG